MGNPREGFVLGFVLGLSQEEGKSKSRVCPWGLSLGFVPGVWPWGLSLGFVPVVCLSMRGNLGEGVGECPKCVTVVSFRRGDVVGSRGRSWDFVGQSLRFRVIFLAKLDRLGSAVESEAQRQRASRVVSAVAAGAGTAALCAQTKAHSAACLVRHAESRCPKRGTTGIGFRV